MATKARRWLGLTITLVVIGLLVAVVALGKDEFARARFERKLENVYEHTGTVGSAEVHLFERRLVFYDIVLKRVDGPVDEPFVIIDRLEVDIRGPMISSASKTDLTATGVRAHLVRASDSTDSQMKPSKQALEDIQNLSRWQNDTITIADAAVTYVDKPLKMTLELKALDATLRNFVAARSDQREPLLFTASGTLEGGKLELDGSSQIGVDKPTFKLEGSIVGFPMMRISTLFKRQTDLKIRDGYATLGVKIDGDDGKHKGHFAPRFANLDLVDDGKRPLAGAIQAFAVEKASDKIDKPNRRKNTKRIEFVGRYGGPGGWTFEAVDEGNSWLQKKVLAGRR